MKGLNIFKLKPVQTTGTSQTDVMSQKAVTDLAVEIVEINFWTEVNPGAQASGSLWYNPVDNSLNRFFDNDWHDIGFEEKKVYICKDDSGTNYLFEYYYDSESSLLVELNSRPFATDATVITGTNETAPVNSKGVLAGFMNWITTKVFSGLTTTDKTIQGAINENNTKKVSRKGGTIYNPAKWFSPNANQTITISSDGLSATLANPVANFQFTSGMVSALMEVNGVENIISAYTSTSVVSFATAWPVAMRGQVYTYNNFGVHNKCIVLNNGGITIYSGAQSGGAGADTIILDYSAGYISNQYGLNVSNRIGLQYDTALSNSYKLAWSSTSDFSGSKDIGIKRNSAGVLEINDGNTGGVYRDLNLRNLNYTGSLTNTSDIRLKQNLRPVTDGLKKVIDIAKTIRHYEFIDQDAYGSGVITSEIAQLLLELGFDGHVKQRLPRNPDEGKLFGWEYEQKPILDTDGNPLLDKEGLPINETAVTKEGDLIYTVDSQALTIYLFPAIVELNERIIAIEERLTKGGL